MSTSKRDAFYNTTHESGATLAEYEAKAATQDEVITAIYESHWPKPLSPSQVHNLMGGKCPLTSVRRSITNLTNRNVLSKTMDKHQGAYGRPEYCWTFNRPVTQVDMFDEVLKVLP